MTAPAAAPDMDHDRLVAFPKIFPAGGGAQEVQGWHAVAEHLPVPQLLHYRRTAAEDIVLYEDVFASGRCHQLLADTINTADHDPRHAPAVANLVNAVCDSLLASVRTTGAVVPMHACVPDLYATRLCPGGRLDRWYASAAGVSWTLPAATVNLAQLTDQPYVVNGTVHRLHVPQLVHATRAKLAPGRPVVSALTQGDPTEPNITEPLCWLDFEYAGRNSLAGELANLLWYLLAMGGWLVPTYQPDTYHRTVRWPIPPTTRPAADRMHITSRYLELGYTWHLGTGRAAALRTLVARLTTDLAAALIEAGAEDVFDALRPFLAVRILGVIPLGQMTGPDAMLCLAKLAQLTDPGCTLAAFAETGGGAP